MLIDEKDRPIVRWAIEKAYTFDYCRENGLPDPCLRIRLGLSTAFFHKGKLVHWAASSAGEHLDHLLQEMTLLFGLCAERKAYVAPHVRFSPGWGIGA
jgi:hypothetical protein